MNGRRHALFEVKRSTFILLTDAAAFIGFVLLVSSGVLLHYLLPAGSGRWLAVLGLNRHEWGTIHFYVAATFFFVLSLHLILHWRAILGMVKGAEGGAQRWRLALGVIGLLALLAIAAVPWIAGTEETAADFRGGGQGKRLQGR